MQFETGLNAPVAPTSPGAMQGGASVLNAAGSAQQRPGALSPLLGDAIAEAASARPFDALQGATAALNGGQFGQGIVAQAMDRLIAIVEQAAQNTPGLSDPAVNVALERLASAVFADGLNGSSASQDDPSFLAAAQKAVNVAQLGNAAEPVEAAGLPDPGLLANVVRFVETALIAASPAESALATAIFGAMVKEAGPESVVSALTMLANAAPAAATQTSALPLALIAPAPQSQADVVRSLPSRQQTQSGDEDRREKPEDLIPERDEQGRPYSAEERAQLVRLGIDPRRGSAPEARIAILARRAFGLEFERDPNGQHDFIDTSGELWDLVVEFDDERRGEAIARASNAHLLVVSKDGLALHPRGGAV